MKPCAERKGLVKKSFEEHNCSGDICAGLFVAAGRGRTPEASAFANAATFVNFADQFSGLVDFAVVFDLADFGTRLSNGSVRINSTDR